jgi:2-dehydropantoate 2-reductase
VVLNYICPVNFCSSILLLCSAFKKYIFKSFFFMKITILGGTGAMGGVFGARLFQGNCDVTLFDTNRVAVEKVQAQGLEFLDRDGSTHHLNIRATTDPAAVPAADVVIVFVKGMYTKVALESATPFMQPHTRVLSLQNGWGHADVIGSVVGLDRLASGVTYASGVVLGPGHVKQVGGLDLFLGNFARPNDAIVTELGEIFNRIGFNAVVSDNVVVDIWKKLSLNVCTLPTSAIPRLTADQVPTHEGLVALMQGILRETVAVAQANGIALDYQERIDYIVNLLKNAKGGRSSMLQDVEARRITEIDFINGAIVKAGEKAGIPTPYNHAMVCLIRAIQDDYLRQS